MTEASKPDPTGAPLIVNSVAAPVVYADNFLGFIESQGTTRMTFATLHADHSGSGGPPAHVVSLRLIMPTEVAEEFAEKLLSYVRSTKAITKAKAQPPATPLH